MKTFSRLALMLVLALPLLGWECQWPISDEDDPVAAPLPRPDDFLFSAQIQVFITGQTIGVSSSLFVTCSPQEHPSCGGDCIYRLEVDGVSQGNALSSNSFGLTLASRPDDAYALQCVHEPTNSKSGIAFIVVP